jgi:hypothetical protein
MVVGAYSGGVYHPRTNRIYFIPSGQILTWHYVKCDTGQIVSYVAGAGLAANNFYSGGVLIPRTDQIMFIPASQAAMPNWHRIEADGSLTTYANGISPALTVVFNGGAYSPTQDKVFLVPSDPTIPSWPYFNVAAQNIGTFVSGSPSIINGYGGAIYSLTDNRVYLLPLTAWTLSTWHYIDCASLTIKSYTNAISLLPVSSFRGGRLVSLLNRIYLTPLAGSNGANYIYLDLYKDSGLQPILFPNTTDTPVAVANAFQEIALSPKEGKLYYISNNAAVNCLTLTLPESFPVGDNYQFDGYI